MRSQVERLQRLTILDKDGVYCPLIFNAEQEEIYRLIVEELALRGDADILKDRRIGVSTLILSIFYDEVKMKKGVNAQVITHENDASKEFREIIKRFWSWDEDRPPIQYDNAGTFSVEGNDSRIYIGTVGRRGTGRARTIHLLLCTETAQWPEYLAQDAWLGLSQAAQRGLRIRESTPRGRENFHHREWKKAREKRPDTCLFFRWFDHEEYREDWPAMNLTDEEEVVARAYGLDLYQVAWRREMIDVLGEDGFTQEYPEDEETCFLVTGLTVFEKSVLLRWLRQVEGRQPLLDRGDMVIWEFPVEGRVYVAGSDVAGGSPLGDKSATYVLDWKTGRKVARVWGHMSPQSFAAKSFALCSQYNNAYWGIEDANHGKTVLHIVAGDHPYPNLHYRDLKFPGFNTNVSTRPVILDLLKRAVREELFEPMDREFVLECLSFVRTAAKPDGEADAGALDDLVFANAIAWRMRDFAGPPPEFEARELLP